ncbi:N-acetylmuramic acid 6-phosphate etherase [uncultured Pontibacter sp.]|uniref:N-acetylmuramic acid 6-phosphate etherase n=1 Tax=uncultured Pontibacter sp. TaxID=453356 RepID=UPI00260E2BFF|nr:N-acetylmuramic acid 6-phosphate etherase [uncultured Pontibacter sp.]
MSTTESASYYDSLEQMSIRELLNNINREDKTVPIAIEAAIPQLERLVEATVAKLQEGGRLFYIGAGTSGRLGIVDASECPPTYGVPHGMVVGLIAGGDTAIRKAVEFAEDDEAQAWKDLQQHNITSKDIVVGIAASGRTPYVIGGMKECRAQGITTGCIVCNAGSAVAAEADYPVEIVTGPEFVTGSTRMKAGTAQKLALNMLTTSVMIKLGRIKGNKMVDMQLSNVKLVDRGTRMVMEELNLTRPEAAALLKKFGSVRAAMEAYKNGNECS